MKTLVEIEGSFHSLLVCKFCKPEVNEKHHLFEIHVKHESNDPFRFITANDINIYPLQPDLRIKVDEWLASDRRDMTMDRELTELFDTCDPGHYQMESPLTQKQKDKILRPFEFRGNKHYCLLHELKHTGTDGMYQEVHCFGSPSVKTTNTRTHTSYL